MKVISFAAIKGGVGKTTLSIFLGQYLAKQGKRVLLIDLDHQCNMTHYFEIYTNANTVANIFANQGDVDITNVSENIDLIPGSMLLDDYERLLETDNNKHMYLYDWFNQNQHTKGLINYDYVIIDCRPDFGIATKNAIAVSHVLFSPVIPSDFSYESKTNLELRLEKYRKDEIVRPTYESLITAKLYFIPNKIAHNKNKAKDLIKALEGQENITKAIPDRELFNKSTKDYTMVDMMADKKQSEHKKFFVKLTEVAEELIDITNHS